MEALGRLLLLSLPALMFPGGLLGQGSIDSDLLARCGAGAVPLGEPRPVPTEDLPLCFDVVAAIQVTQPELGLALAGGNPVLGTASPIGAKFRFIPRIYVGGRINFVWAEIPDIRDYPDDPAQPLEIIGYAVPMPQLDFSIGLFEGLALGSTVGGFASVELLGSFGPMILPAGVGFANDASGFGLGARLGLLRESFTAPGISLSGEYQWAGRIQYGDVGNGDDAQFGADLKVASFRAGVSKSFVSVGLAFTLAYDRYMSDIDFGIADAQGDLLTVVPASAPADLTSDRWSAFLDASYIVLFFSIVGELGWQEQQALSTWTGREITSGKLFVSIGIRASL